MRASLRTIALLTSLSSLAASANVAFNPEAFRAKLARDILIVDISIMCGSQGNELAEIYSKGNKLVEAHGLKGDLPSKKDLCEKSISEALANGITIEEIDEVLLHIENKKN